MRRNSSLSVASSMGSEDSEEDTADWTDGEKEKLKRVSHFVSSSLTRSFSGEGWPT